MDLALNKDNSKYMLTTSGEVPRIGSQIMANCYNFDVAKEFIYHGSAINTNNDVSLEIKCRVTLANRYYFGLNRQLSSRDLSRTTKLIIYKAHILPVLLYGAMGAVKHRCLRSVREKSAAQEFWSSKSWR